MSTPYDLSHQPAFPVLQVTLSFSDQQLGPLLGLVDSGADATLVPTEFLERIRAVEGPQAFVRSHFGDAFPVQMYLVEIRIAHYQLPGRYVVGDDEGDEIVLGRDVLNQLSILLDGPLGLASILDGSPLARLRASRPNA